MTHTESSPVSSPAQGVGEQDNAGKENAADEAADRPWRAASRRLPSGVSVLTAAHGDLVHGATASTVAVVSQRPLTLSASLREGSLLASLARDSGSFTVNVLSSRQALVADWFANPRRPGGRRQFDLVDWEPVDSSGTPLLSGALAHLLCRTRDAIPVGDADVLLLAEVVGARIRHGRPLVAYDGGLHDVEFRDVVRRERWRPAQSVMTE